MLKKSFILILFIAALIDVFIIYIGLYFIFNVSLLTAFKIMMVLFISFILILKLAKLVDDYVTRKKTLYY